MDKIIREYEDKLQEAIDSIENTSNTGSINDVRKHARLNCQAGLYRNFIDKLKKIQTEQEETYKTYSNNLATITRLYHGYKHTADSKIRECLENIKIVKKEVHAGGKKIKYYPLNAKAMKKIKERPRNVSLTFDATEVTTKSISGLEEYKKIPYLCKSTSRFFLKPDIGEIFDAIDFHDLYGNKFNAICFDDDYETLPNTDGEHHLMYATLLVDKKIRVEKEKQEAINYLNLM